MQNESRMHDLSHEGTCQICGKRMVSEMDVMTSCPGPIQNLFLVDEQEARRIAQRRISDG